MQACLPFQREIFTDLVDQDGLLILAKGLGLTQILLSLLQLAVERQTLVLLVNVQSAEEEELQLQLTALTGGQTTLKLLKNDTKAEDRAIAYSQGGLLSVTSRILVVDMLKQRVPVSLITGIIVANAHKVSSHSLEAFILRLYREENTDGFIKALSDAPEAFGHGFAPLETSLKSLQLRRTLLWPRFHVTVKASLDTTSKEVIELRQPMTERMKQIQGAIIECLDACLGELRRAHTSLDIEQLTVENALLKSFDVIVRRQLDPLWHQISQRTKRLVNDMQTLRQLLVYLLSYDCVAFNAYLDTLMASQSTSTSIGGYTQPPSLWMMMDAANVLFNTARERVYRRDRHATTPATLSDHTRGSTGKSDIIPSDVELVLEEQPKWTLLRNTLMEIHKEETDRKGCIIVLVQDARTARQLETYWVEYKAAHSNTAGCAMLYNAATKYFQWKQQFTKITTSATSTAQNTSTTTGYNRDGRNTSGAQRGAPLGKRRRVRGGASGVASTSRSAHDTPTSTPIKTDINDVDFSGNAMMTTTSQEPNTNENDEDISNNNSDNNTAMASMIDSISTISKNINNNASMLNTEDDKVISLVEEQHLLVIRPVSGSADDRLLQDLQPSHIIIYDPNPMLVRQVEVYQAQHKDQPARVYFMLYADSVEEQRYLSDIRREKASFERLIHENSVMALPMPIKNKSVADEDNMFIKVFNARQGGSSRRVVLSDVMPQVIVDMREFRSTLPPILHEQGMKIVPCTLIVGDYVLSPDICIERKSIADLIGSFQSGRLYTQADAMCAHYETPVLLIEFDEQKSFSLQSVQDIGSDISIQDLTSKLSLLCITFPKLRIIWSSSAYATANIFADLKKNHLEPNADDAAMIGATDKEDAQVSVNLTSQELLRSLPGITSLNYRLIARKVRSLDKLITMSQDALAEIIGENGARQLFKFLHNDSL